MPYTIPQRLLTAALLIVLAACSGGDSSDPPGGTAMVSAPPPATPDNANCTILGSPIAGDDGSYSVHECLPPADDPRGAVRLRFVLEGASGRSFTDYTMDAITYSTVASGAAPRLWEDHILTLDLRAGRDGRLLIANHTDAGFVLSNHDYQVDDGDSLQLGWNRGSFVATTQAGQIRLVPATTTGAVYGEFEPEWLGCTQEDDEGAYHSLSLPVDVNGRILAVSYFSALPTLDGTPLMCSLEYSRADGESEWADDGFGGTVITLNEGVVNELEPDQVEITRVGSTYAVDLFVSPDVYCEPSARIASEIGFDVISHDCTTLLMEFAGGLPSRAGRTMAD